MILWKHGLFWWNLVPMEKRQVLFCHFFDDNVERTNNFLHKFNGNVESTSKYLNKFSNADEGEIFLQKFVNGNEANEFIWEFNDSPNCASKFVKSFDSSKETLDHFEMIKKECDGKNG